MTVYRHPAPPLNWLQGHPWAAAALHSTTLDAVGRQEPDVAGLLFLRLGGITHELFWGALGRGAFRLNTLVDDSDGFTWISVSTPIDDGTWQVITAPPARLLGLEADELRLMHEAWAAAIDEQAPVSEFQPHREPRDLPPIKETE